MKKQIIIAVLSSFVVFSCSETKTDHEKVGTNTLKTILDGFIKYIPNNNLLNPKVQDAITIDLFSKKDTTVIAISNSIPLLSGKYNGYINYRDFRVFFMGESEPNLIFERLIIKIPKDIELENKKLLDKNYPPYAFDPLVCYFYLLNGRIINYEPKNIISNFYPSN